MHPVDIENYNYTPSEKYMYEAFRDRLDKKYHVFYSVRWFEIDGGKRIDSESDFIVFDPSFGFIAIEVKGGKDIIQEGEHWFLIETKDGEESTRKLKCSPYEQAEKSMQKRQRSGDLSVRQLPVYRTERQSTALNTAKEFNQNVDSRNKG